MNGDFTIITLAGSMLALIWLVVRYFIGAMTKKDEQIIKMITDFNRTVSSYMEHQTLAFNALSKAIKELTKEIRNGR